MGFEKKDLEKLENGLKEAFLSMRGVEAGEIANPDEQRMVGHYWLREPSRAPQSAISEEILSTVSEIKKFATRIHSGDLLSSSGKKFKALLVVGIGGSALGPQFVYDSLRTHGDPIRCFFIDNTDADGMSRALEDVGDLQECLCIVISKSGGTRETRNGCAIVRSQFERQGVGFVGNAVAVTGKGSSLFNQAQDEGWLKVFPMWDWVGGRTSVLSAVGLLPAALQGLDIDELLLGARLMDEQTRGEDFFNNPAGLLAAAWHLSGDGVGKRDMVILPYKDRLLLFSRYLQQLVMESLGKEKDLAGKVVHQGISVFGNKGSTDQHAYVQQLRDGLDNFFVIFVEVLRDDIARSGQTTAKTLSEYEVEPGVTCGDYLIGFSQGTQEALTENQRMNLTISLEQLNERSLGALIALFERAVGLYASLVGINAYHQPGVEAGKKAAARVLELQAQVIQCVKEASAPTTLDTICSTLKVQEREVQVLTILRHLAANGRLQVKEGQSVFDDLYSLSN